MLKMDQVHVLRHQVLNEGRSIRRVARELGISRNTVAKYLEQSEPVRRRGRPRGRPVCGELLIFDTNQQFATHRSGTGHYPLAGVSAAGPST